MRRDLHSTTTTRKQPYMTGFLRRRGVKRIEQRAKFGKCLRGDADSGDPAKILFLDRAVVVGLRVNGRYERERGEVERRIDVDHVDAYWRENCEFEKTGPLICMSRESFSAATPGSGR